MALIIENKLIFMVQGSACDPYKVTFQKVGSKLSAFCTCPAGENGQYCKHRFNILNGVSESIINEKYHESEILKSWLTGTDVEVALNEVVIAEEEFEVAKRNLAAAKRELAKAFRK